MYEWDVCKYQTQSRLKSWSDLGFKFKEKVENVKKIKFLLCLTHSMKQKLQFQKNVETFQFREKKVGNVILPDKNQTKFEIFPDKIWNVTLSNEHHETKYGEGSSTLRVLRAEIWLTVCRSIYYNTDARGYWFVSGPRLFVLFLALWPCCENRKLVQIWSVSFRS